MTQLLDDTILDNGLSSLDAATDLILVLCSVAPTTRAEAATLYDGGANKYRLTAEIALAAVDTTLQNKAGGGREVVFAAKSTTAAATIAAGSDCHYAIYNGTTLLAVADETSDQAITSGNTVNFPSFKIDMSVVA